MRKPAPVTLRCYSYSLRCHLSFGIDLYPHKCLQGCVFWLFQFCSIFALRTRSPPLSTILKLECLLLLHKCGYSDHKSRVTSLLTLGPLTIRVRPY